MDPILTVNDKTLSFNQLAIDLLEVRPGDRIDIQYWMTENDCFPVIGKADVFKTEGKKLTKSGTISYRGEQNTMLKEYGNTFIVLPFKNGMFQMCTIEIG